MTYQPGNIEPVQPEPQPVQPVQQPQLPTYQPRGMRTGDKLAAWLLAFIIIGTALFVGVAFLIHTNRIGAAPHPHTSVSTTVSNHSHAARIYVVVDVKTGYVWWLDPTGAHFTQHTARVFAHGHSGYVVAFLRRDK